MALAAAPPHYEAWKDMFASINRGERDSWRVYALQSALRSLGYHLAVDGTFGENTEHQVTIYQKRHNLDADGHAGALQTQPALLNSIVARVEDGLSLPKKLLKGYVKYEGANILAATNEYTPPNQPHGIDCGPAQWRQIGPPYSMAGLRMAFDPWVALLHAGRDLETREQNYLSRRPGLGRAAALRAAILAHNAPFLAEQIVRYGHLLTPSAVAAWTTRPDGGHYTHAEWAQVYVDRIMEFVS